ncbi:hypothetical protein [Streptomyces sp. ODS28]|uniref:hypothetical protein n=1 Tax=Streptomyces sp. ODS28 TaxID=3136688 RepID=UPI0031EF766D
MTERNPGSLPPEEEAAWARIVAGYGEEAERPGEDEAGGREGESPRDPEDHPGPSSPSGPSVVRSFTVYEAGAGPRDWSAPDDEDGEGEDDEGHFVPPEPPPLPETDVTTKFAWIAAVGGPLLLLGTMLLGQPMQWWVVLLGVGGFLGGFATLVARMRDDDEDDDDPGRGAVV